MGLSRGEIRRPGQRGEGDILLKAYYLTDMLCLACKHLNPRTASSCEICRTPLPSREPPPPIFTNLNKIRTAIAQVTRGEITFTQFEELVAGLEKLFREKLAEVSGISIPDDMIAEMKDEMDVGTEGIKIYLQSLVPLRRYLEEHNVDYLSQGLALAEVANNKMNQALLLNWRAFRSLQESAEEYISTNTV